MTTRTDTRHDHWKQSQVVRSWKAKAVHPITASVTGDKTLADNGASAHILTSPLPGYVIRVSFSPIPAHPGLMAVRSTNWSAEDEPRGIYAIEDCRKFYTALLEVGFVKETK